MGGGESTLKQYNLDVTVEPISSGGNDILNGLLQLEWLQSLILNGTENNLVITMSVGDESNLFGFTVLYDGVTYNSSVISNTPYVHELYVPLDVDGGLSVDFSLFYDDVSYDFSLVDTLIKGNLIAIQRSV